MEGGLHDGNILPLVRSSGEFIAGAAGEGTVHSLQNHWPWPSWLTLLFLGATVAFVAWCYFGSERGVAGRKTRARVLTVCDSVAIGIVLFMIADFVYNRQRTGLPYVVVVVDDSASMKIADRYEDSAERSTLSAGRKWPATIRSRG